MNTNHKQGAKSVPISYKHLPPNAQAAIDDAVAMACVEISRSGYFCNLDDRDLRDALAVYLVESNSEQFPKGGE